jgi:hypothetical protein
MAVVSVEEEAAMAMVVVVVVVEDVATAVVVEDVVVVVMVVAAAADNAGLRCIKFKCQAVDDDLLLRCACIIVLVLVLLCENDSYCSPVSVTSRLSLFVIEFSK